MFRNCIKVCVFLVLLLAVSAYRHAFPTVTRHLINRLSAHKLDNAMIEGELKPLANNVLVKVKDIATSTSGGLFIPDNAKERPTEGTIISVGSGRYHPDTGVLIDMAVSVGDSVIYGKYDGIELKYNDVNHQLIKDDDILLKYKGSEMKLNEVECVKDQVLVKLPPKEEKSASGLIVTTAESKEKRRDHGIVTKVGPGRQAGNGQYMPIQVSPGDGVKFREYAGSIIKIEGQEYVVLRAYDILAKWNN